MVSNYVSEFEVEVASLKVNAWIRPSMTSSPSSGEYKNDDVRTYQPEDKNRLQNVDGMLIFICKLYRKSHPNSNTLLLQIHIYGT